MIQLQELQPNGKALYSGGNHGIDPVRAAQLTQRHLRGESLVNEPLGRTPDHVYDAALTAVSGERNHSIRPLERPALAGAANVAIHHAIIVEQAPSMTYTLTPGGQ